MPLCHIKRQATEPEDHLQLLARATFFFPHRDLSTTVATINRFRQVLSGISGRRTVSLDNKTSNPKNQQDASSQLPSSPPPPPAPIWHLGCGCGSNRVHTRAQRKHQRHLAEPPAPRHRHLVARPGDASRLRQRQSTREDRRQRVPQVRLPRDHQLQQEVWSLHHQRLHRRQVGKDQRHKHVQCCGCEEGWIHE